MGCCILVDMCAHMRACGHAWFMKRSKHTHTHTHTHTCVACPGVRSTRTHTSTHPLTAPYISLSAGARALRASRTRFPLGICVYVYTHTYIYVLYMYVYTHTPCCAKSHTRFPLCKSNLAGPAPTGRPGDLALNARKGNTGAHAHTRSRVRACRARRAAGQRHGTPVCTATSVGDFAGPLALPGIRVSARARRSVWRTARTGAERRDAWQQRTDGRDSLPALPRDS